jgi:putative transposase
MNKLSIITSLINITSKIQTSLVNYLEFMSVEPKQLINEDYLKLSPRPYPREKPPAPFQKEQIIRPHYTILLQIAREQGKEIKPITRRYTPLRVKVNCCRKCKAPAQYLRNHGFYRPKKNNKKFPRLTCKICSAEYAPDAQRHKPKHKCPYCAFALNPKTYRKNYTVYFCEREECPHRKLHPEGNRYNEKIWNFDYNTLIYDLPESSKKLQNIKTPKHVLDLEMSLFVESGMTARETVKILQKVYGPQIMKSQQTVLNHAEALVNYISNNEKILPMPISEKNCQDETYIRYNGKWAYLFRSFNPENRAIIAEYLSPYRDTKSCIILNKKVSEIYLANYMDPAYKLIADRAPIYGAMQKYMKQHEKANIDLHQIKGIFDEPDEENSEFRPEKQMIERSFESLKSAIKRRRSFSSFKGTQNFCYLNRIYYNYLRTHSELNNPPILLFLKSGRKVTNWHELLQYISEKQ